MSAVSLGQNHDIKDALRIFRLFSKNFPPKIFELCHLATLEGHANPVWHLGTTARV